MEYRINAKTIKLFKNLKVWLKGHVLVQSKFAGLHSIFHIRHTILNILYSRFSLIRSRYRKLDSSRKKRLLALAAVILIILPTIIFTMINKRDAQAAWYSDTWGFRKKLTIDYTKVSGGADLTSFPVLVSVTDSSLSKAQSGGNDILFTSNDGITKLDHEIEKFTQSSGQLIAWVRIPTLSYQTNTIIYLYYGNFSAPSQQNKTGVWDASYVGVWHLSETSGHHLNSTSVANLDSSTETVTQQGANIGIADGADDFDGINDLVQVPDNDVFDLNTLTLESWVKFDSLPTTRAETAELLEKFGSSTTAYGLYVASTNNTLNMFWRNTTPSAFVGWGSVSYPLDQTGNWYYTVGTKDNSSLKVFVNGTDRTSSSGTPTGTVLLTDGTVRFGAEHSSGYRVDGQQDEIRISNTNRSAGWIATTYNTINSPSTFFTKGSEEKTRRPVLSYGFDEGFGTATSDGSPSGNHGTLSGASLPTWQTEDMCVSGKCLYYSGTTGYVASATAPTVSATSSFSYSYWINVKSYTNGTLTDGNGSYFLDRTTGTNDLVSLKAVSDKFGFQVRYNDGTGLGGITGTTTIPLNTWVHVTMVRDYNSQFRLYVNGNPEGTLTDTGSKSLVLPIPKIGTHATSGVGLIGFVDDFKLYDYARSAAQVKTDYVRGSPAGSTASYGPDTTFLSQGLVGYWKMDGAGIDAEGETSTDSSGNANNGTLYGDNSTGDNGTGLDCTAQGKFGTGCSLDGTDDYLDMGDNYDFTDGQDFTLVAWINRSTPNTYDAIISKKNDTTNGTTGYALWLDNTNNDINFQVTDNDQTEAYTVNGSTAITSSGWHQIIAVYDDDSETGTTIYLDGVNDEQSTSGTLANQGNLTSGPNFKIGIMSTTRPFSGSIDETRVYNRALTPSEIRQLADWAPGPVGYWKFDEGSGTTRYDSSGNDNTITNYSGSASYVKWVTGKYGSALNFDGSGYIYRSANAQLNPEGVKGITVSAWVNPKLTGGGTYPRVVRNERWVSDADCGGYMLTITNAGIAMFNIKNNSGGVHADTTVVANEWVYLSGTYDGSNVRLYKNGVLQQTSPQVSGFGTYPASPLEIGGTSNFNGLIDDVKIYNYARTPSQIIEDMNAGHPAPGSPVGSALIHWNFDEGYGSLAHNTGNGGSGLNGSITNGTWTNSGKFGKALTFTASTSVTATITDPAYTHTISLWVYPTTSAASKTLVTAGKLTTDSSSRPVYGNCTGTALTLDTWSHLVAISNGSGSCALFQNGLQTATSTTGVTFGTSLNLGGTSFTGNIDEFNFFTAVLTADQVKQLYNGGVATVFGATSTDSSGNASWSAANEYCPPGQGSVCTPPVAEWKFDEKSGLVAYDTSGNGYHFNMNASTIWIRGKSGSGQEAIATHSVAAAPISYLDNASAFTIAYWSKIITHQDNGNTCATKNVDSNNRIEIKENWAANQGRLLFFIANGSSSYGYADNLFSLGQWFHVEEVFNGGGSDNASRLKVYINGQPITLSFSGTIPATTANLAAANYNAANGGYNHVDEMKIYNYARTPAQVAWDYNQGAPLAHWRFDECTGSVANNSSGNGFTGTITPGGAPNTATGTCNSGDSAHMWNDGTTGKRNASLGFDGTDDFVDIGNNFEYSLPISFSAWIKLNSNSIVQTIIATDKTGHSNHTGAWLDITTTGKADVGFADNTGCTSSDYRRKIGATTLSTGIWYHIAGVMRGATDMDVYVNGKNDGGSYDGTGGTIAYTGDSGAIGKIANCPSGDFFFDGLIDDVKIFSYALTAQQVKNEYNDGAVKFGP